MAAGREDVLHGRWVRSHEEESDGEMVFRPSTHAFPPSRGRSSFELRPDGSYVERSPGPVDRPVESTGSWSLEGERLVLRAEGDRAGHAWEIVTAGSDRLVLKK
ncbi:MAG: hypothetical protein LC685_02725 [Actinobacteria bacterium]|nr:hypothetical protein [Actinomycetota bacterium]